MVFCRKNRAREKASNISKRMIPKYLLHGTISTFFSVDDGKPQKNTKFGRVRMTF